MQVPCTTVQVPCECHPLMCNLAQYHALRWSTVHYCEGPCRAWCKCNIRLSSHRSLLYWNWMSSMRVTGIGDPILSLCVYFPLLSICITWLSSILVSSSHMWQFIFFYLSNHHYIYSASGIVSYHIPPWSIVSDLSLAGFLNTLLEVFSHGTALYTYHLPVSPSWGFPEKEQRSCNRFLKHQRSPLDTC